MEYKEMMSQIKSAEHALMMNGFQKDIEDEGMYIDYFRHPKGYGIDVRPHIPFRPSTTLTNNQTT